MTRLWVCAGGVLSLWLGTLQAIEPRLEAVVEHTGMCDASAAAALPGGLVAVADDEQNMLRIYRAGEGGLPVRQVRLDPLAARLGGAETDLEGAAVIGQRVYWISSHGRNAAGKPAPSRHRLLAMEMVEVDGLPTLRSIGRPYTRLLSDVQADARLRALGLVQAAQRAPKQAGGLNIEGLAATPEGGLLVGFRNPVPRGRALVVPLLNPHEVVLGAAAELGEPTLLDLGGLGIRSLERVEGRYLIVAGPSGDQREPARVFEWGGPGEVAVELKWPGLEGLNAEGLVCGEDAEGAWLGVLSDDGTRLVDGVPCKKVKDPLRKTFRTAWYRW